MLNCAQPRDAWLWYALRADSQTRDKATHEPKESVQAPSCCSRIDLTAVGRAENMATRAATCKFNLFLFFKLKLITFYWTFQVAAKVRNLHDYQLRLMNNAASPPSGNDVANTLKYFSQTLLGIDWSISFFFSLLFVFCYIIHIFRI